MVRYFVCIIKVSVLRKFTADYLVRYLKIEKKGVYEPIIEIKILLYGIIKIGFSGLDARAVNNSYGNTDTF